MRSNNKSDLREVTFFALVAAAFIGIMAMGVFGFIQDQQRIKTIDAENFRMETH